MLLALPHAVLAQSSSAHPALTPLAALPLYFEPNVGQAQGPAQFLARGLNYQFLIGPRDAQLVLRKVASSTPDSPPGRHLPSSPSQVMTRAVRLQFLQANPKARMQGDGLTPGTINYLIGNNPAAWHTNLSTFARVGVEGLYPGINLAYHGHDQQLEYDFTVAPGADPSNIVIRFEGADKIAVDNSGELVISLGADQIRQPHPTLYQVAGGVRRIVQGGYQLVDARTAQFAIGPYDHTQTLVIDPVLSYSTYFGGNFGDVALSVKVDTNGFVYFAGQTLSTSFPFTVPPGSFQGTFQGGSLNGDAFVAKLSNTGTNLVYLTYLGGSAEDAANDLAVDNSGNAYVTGFTDSTNFPHVNALYPSINGALAANTHLFPLDAFVAELNSAGSGLVYSTYLGGLADDLAEGIALDPSGNTYVSGYTLSTNFPTTNALVFVSSGGTNVVMDHLIGGRDAFVAKLSPGGTNLVYCSFLGGSGAEEGAGIAADSNGVAYVTGYTISVDFPVSTNAFQPFLNKSTNLTVNYDAFVTQIAPGGSNILFSSYLGGTNNDIGFRITLDSLGCAYVTGMSQSPDFITVTNNPSLTNLIVGEDAFLAKINFASNNPAIVYSTVFGGFGNDIGWDVAVDPAGNAFVVGTTDAVGLFPTTNTSGFLRPTNSGGLDAFVIAFNTNASALLYSAYFGGSGDDYGYGIAVDAAGNAYIVGRTLSTDFPVVSVFTNSPVLQTNLNGGNDAYVAKILMNPTLTAVAAGNAVQLRWARFSSEFTLQANTNVSSPATWAPVAQSPMLSNGWHTVTLPATNPQSFFRLTK